MPKVDKKRSDAKTTPYKKLAQAVSRIVTSASQVRMARSASPTPPPSPGAEERAQEEWLQKKQVDLQKKIGKMEASVLAAQQTLAAGMDAESLLAYDELRHLGVENVFTTVEQAGVMSDSSSEDSDTESESEKSTEY
jgi:hypothetical protein